MSFTLFTMIGCDNSDTTRPPNLQGEIVGLDGGEFRALMGKGLMFLSENEFGDFENQAVKLVSSKNELIEWSNSVMLELYLYDRITLEYLEEFNPYYLFAEYCDSFFETNQLVFISFIGGVLEYEVREVSYINNILTIDFNAIPPPRGYLIPPAWQTRTAILEITRIADDLEIDFSSRRR